MTSPERGHGAWEAGSSPASRLARTTWGIRRFVAARLDHESRLGLWLTVGVAVFAAGVWAFSGLLEEVLDNEALVQRDLAASRWLHAHATPAGPHRRGSRAAGSRSLTAHGTEGRALCQFTKR